MGKGSAPSDSAIELRSLPAAAPLVSDSGVAASLVRVSRSAVPSLSASPSSPGMSASGMPLVPGTTEALSGPQAGTVQDLSVVARQRRVIEVRSGAEPISLSAFATTGAGAQRQPNALSPAPSPEPGIERFADPVPSGTSGSAPSVTGPVSNPDDADLSALQASADSSTLTPVAPTVGLRRGLGSPMSSLPPSAVSRLADPDPFAGWNDVPAPELPVAGRDLTATGPTAAPGSPGSPGSPTGGSRHTGFIDAAGSGLVSRSPDSVPSASGSGASAQVSDGGSPAEESDTAAPVVAAGIDPREAGPGAHFDDPYVGLQRVSNGGPLIGQRRFDVVLQETLMPLSVSPHEVASAPVNLQWGSNTDDRAAAPRTTGPGSSVASVASVQRTADHTGSSSGSPRGAASVLRGSVPGRPAAASFGSSAGSASVSWPGTPSSAAVLRSLSTASAGGAPNRGPSTFVGFAGGERAGGPVPPTVAGVVDPAAPWEDEPVSRWLPVVGGSGSDQVRRVPETSAVPPAVRPSPSANPVRNVVEVWREADEGPTPPAGQDLPPGSGPPADGAPPAGNGAGDPGSGQSAAAAPPTGAGGAGAGAAGGGSDADLDQLAGRLYERIRQRLRRELLDDRERAGFSLDRVR